jgi:single-strand DNA-binding protein
MIIGNVGREPELRFTSAGKPVTSFSVAVSRRWTDSKGARREETEWFNVVAWGNLAEICAQYLDKGQQVYVEGRLQTRNWENKDGQRLYRTDVVANEVTILDRRRHNNHFDNDTEQTTHEDTLENPISSMVE